MKWENYYKRKRINIEKWLVVNKINSYQKFVEHCQSLGVTPPSKDEMSSFFTKKKEKTMEPEPQALTQGEIPSLDENLQEKKTKKKKSSKTSSDEE